MKPLKIVIDTNVILSGLTSRNGSSYKLLKILPTNKVAIALSVPLLFEYESILIKNIKNLNLSKTDIDDFLDYLCSIAEHTSIYYLWRPILKDPYDDHILELAVSASAKYIVTFNLKDFTEANKFGILPITPDMLLLKL
ncbi:MAG: putative toxin-antitoxin system toxin component, PIN family [Spirochaetes bacterium RBG_16_49_21]|nr:MAG: putative toxin-antitoxin system toxin component, PIN family [Spirochaetes bacterium RBG_16_49_21]